MSNVLIYLHDFFEQEKSLTEIAARKAALENSISVMRPFLYGELNEESKEEFKLKHILARVEPILDLTDFHDTIIIFTHDASAPLCALLMEHSKIKRKFMHITLNPLWDFAMMRRELFKKGRYKIMYRGDLEQELTKTLLHEWTSILHLPKDTNSIIISDLEYDELHNTKHESYTRIPYSRELESLYFKKLTETLSNIFKNLS